MMNWGFLTIGGHPDCCLGVRTSYSKGIPYCDYPGDGYEQADLPIPAGKGARWPVIQNNSPSSASLRNGRYGCRSSSPFG
jgi:hypothetical protein